MSDSSSDNENNNIVVNNDINTTIREKNFNTSSTDMMVDVLANSDKLATTDKRWNYNDKDQDKDQEYSVNKNTHNDAEYNLFRKSDTFTNKCNNANSQHKEKSENNIESASIEKNNFVKCQPTNNQNNTQDKSTEDVMLEKLDMLRKLGELVQYNVKLSRKYDMSSDINAMRYEYKLHTDIRKKKNTINWLSSVLLNCVMGIEFVSERYNPFEFKLKGWSEQMNADITNYYDVFGELYEKYNRPDGKGIPPEIKLIFMFGGSAVKYHLSQQMCGMIPGLSSQTDIDPEIIDYLRQQAISKKLKKQTEDSNKKLNEKMMKEHNDAAQKAADINMLKQKELEFLEKQKKELEKSIKLENLKNKLDTFKANKTDTERSKTKNDQPKFDPPKISENLKQIFDTKNIFNDALQNLNYNNTSSDSSDSVCSQKLTLSPNLESILKTDVRQQSDIRSNITTNNIIDKDDISSIPIRKKIINNKKKTVNAGKKNAIKITNDSP